MNYILDGQTVMDIDGLKVVGAVTNKVVKTITRNMKSKNVHHYLDYHNNHYQLIQHY